MRRELTKYETARAILPKFFEKKPLSKVDMDVLYSVWTRAFQAQHVRFIVNKSEKERKELFQRLFNPEDSRIEEASCFLTNSNKDGEIVGFSLVRPTHGEDNGHLWEFGISPDYQGRGFGKKLLQLTMNSCVGLGLKSMSLGVDPENKPAYELYTKLGFETEGGFTEYAFTVHQEEPIPIIRLLPL